MEHKRDSNLKFIYVVAMSFVYFGVDYILPIGEEMNIQASLVFGFIIISLYISGNMKFNGGKYKKREIIGTLIINFIFFMIWFLYSWDFWLFPLLLIFIGFQILIRYVFIKITYKNSYITVIGNKVQLIKVLSSIEEYKEYQYLKYDEKENGNLLKFIKNNNISKIIVAQTEFADEEIKKLFDIRVSGVEVTNYYDYMQEVEGKIDVDSIDENWILNAYGFKLLYSNFQIEVKRAIDIILAITISLMTLPIMIIAGIIVRIESPGAVIYSQARVGENNAEFMVHKFRSMRADAEKDGAKWASQNDPRVTKFGNFMRKTRIDELPQLWNVLRGEMSFIGPRPERMVFIKELEKTIPYYNLRHLVKPGLTGWAQVMYPYGASVEDSKNKLEYDLYYVKNQNLHLDFVIFFRTLKTVIFGRGR
ncbi:MAG: exopolysaccharide biosynthesis polyprenyl glycosylphosphotransferase [Fusobacteriaceae bacterium]